MTIGHPSRELDPLPLTKLELARYYERVGEWMLPHVQGRPPPGRARSGISDAADHGLGRSTRLHLLSRRLTDGVDENVALDIARPRIVWKQTNHRQCLARLFKLELGTSLVEHRNRLRLARFRNAIERGNKNMLEAALEAGFGSYAQFHRVYRKLVGSSPRVDLGARSFGQGRPRQRGRAR